MTEAEREQERRRRKLPDGLDNIAAKEAAGPHEVALQADCQLAVELGRRLQEDPE